MTYYETYYEIQPPVNISTWCPAYLQALGLGLATEEGKTRAALRHILDQINVPKRPCIKPSPTHIPAAFLALASAKAVQVNA